jgi:hypothetical protein
LAEKKRALSLMHMKTVSRSLLLIVGLFSATIAFGNVPPMTVTVSDSSGKASFKGMTNASGSFATSALPAGDYVVQFNSKDGALKGNYYAVAVSAGKKKVGASAVPGEKFSAGGIAMKVAVGSGLNITGQVLAEKTGKVSKNGKKMVWIPPVLGSNRPGHWVEEGSPEDVDSRSRGVLSKDRVQDMQSRGITPGG